MEEENEVLDWGNEDDEQLHSETHRKASFTEFDSQNGLGDVDDAEDAVSLGEDEEEQDYFGYQRQESNLDAERKDTLLSKPASKDDIHQQQSDTSQRQNSLTSQNPSSVPGSPHLNQSSTDQPHLSPQRSHSFTTRMTHALPPKPVVANVPYLHPSHPSIVEATAMSTRRSESLKNKSNGTSTTASATGTKSNGVDAPLPPDWEARNPRSGGLKVYYYNNQTKQSTWDRPVSSSIATPSLRETRGRSTRRRRDRSQSAGGRPSSPSKSDQPTPQEHSRSSHAQSNLQGDSDITDPQQPSQQSGELSFEDRHYRPQELDKHVATSDNRQGDRHDEPAFTPPASPRRSRERAHGRDRERGRSLSPMRSEPLAPSHGRDSRPSRGSRGSRGGRQGHAITDADSSTQRDRDHSLAAFASPHSAWDHTPSNMPADLNSTNSHQGSHQQRQQQQPHSSNYDSSFEFSAFEDQPSLSRNGSTRGRNRGRDSRATEGREQQNRSQNLSTTSRTRSPPPHLYDRELNTSQRQSDQPPPTPTISTSAPMLEAIPAQPQRRRDRPSRFDRPATMILPVAGIANVPAQIITPVEQTIVRPLEDDVYIPDDIIQASRERIRHMVRDELTPSASQQIVHSNGPSYYDKRSRPDERDPDWDQGQPSAERGRTSPTSEHPASRRKRAPLPPQDIRFHEAVSRPQQAPQAVDSAVPYQHYRPPPPQLSPSQPTMAPPQGPRDHHHQRPANNSNNLPSGPRYPSQSQPRGETDMQRMMPPSSGIDRDGSGRRSDRRSSGTPYAQSLPHSEIVVDVDIDDHPSTSSRIPPSPSMTSEAQAGLRAGAGMYADRENGVGDVLPRGPRAMASKPPPDGALPPPSASLSPTTPYAYVPSAGGRGRDRSPPPQQQGYMNDRGHDNSRHEGTSGRRDERHNHGYPVQERGHGQGRREPRARPNEFIRPTLPKLSGTNSVPIGNRKGGVHGGTPPAGQPPANRFASNLNPPPGISNANMEPLRNPRVRGAPPPEREAYERPSYPVKGQVDTYIPRRSESAGPHQRRRDSPVASEQRQHQRQVSPMDSPTTTRARQESQFSANEKLNRFDHAIPQDPAAPRIWTPRQHSPPRDNTIRRSSLGGGSDFRDATPPPISREPSQMSPTWESSSHGRAGQGTRYPGEDRPQHRFGNPRDVTMNADVRQKQQTNEHMGHGSDRFNSEPEVHQAGSLEGRLGDRYDSQDPFVEAVRQPHALPPNPTLHPDHHSIPPESRRKSFPDRRGPSNQERSQTAWVDAASHGLSNEVHGPRAFDDQGPPPRDNRNLRPQKSFRSRRPLSMNVALQDDSIDADMDVEGFPPESSQYSQQRPVILKRGGSLLDRLSLDHNDDTKGTGMPWSSSLRERVQVPSKRDRDEMMMGGRYQPENSFQGDDTGFGDSTASKKPRRRNPNKFRRGAKRGGMA